MKLLKPIIILTIASMVLTGCGKVQSKGTKGELAIFHAGSLSIPIKVLADSFNVKYPNLKIKPESAGSLTSIRKITDLNRSCDILASADYILIDKLMIPKFASWNLKFAVNEMVIAYNYESLFQDRINSKNWNEILLNDKVVIGRADPASDPCGYRTVLALKLANIIHDDSTLSNHILNKDKKFIRPKEVDLLALLETNTVDYIFLYKSIALQHKLPFISLNDSINLGNPNLSEWYKKVSVVIPGNLPTQLIEQRGDVMIYGITIPHNTSNPEIAKEFINFVISSRGQKIIENCYQEPLKPARFSEKSQLPERH